ncbi:hypothetical protein Pmar_PMAR006866 [Perkinsus marinus ATCC 50983]|uniref:Uncharacterized protein n=1 Tax=Perkinsus marinus (strain ATCC 50983 / TXsc) TaxID=423536 RepID=C5K6Q0_PERM5|nr:hypothetical protein Pmar_PMAR006866 [Perkinsus marinus ATCC 50983]EER19970.1 hypothetical protein Pmar_PMAR006866 [Perkinsus marinus ATCC 50983]|eukprot:XP_002788174.1 hypothetical protein Pmar_PMAR006866 [Perkinsus marinus ATCC 50983]
MRVDPLFTTPILVSPKNTNDNLLTHRSAVRRGGGKQTSTVQLVQPAANCAYIITYEEDSFSTKEVAPLSTRGQRFSLEPSGSGQDSVVRLCYYDSQSNEIKVVSLDTEDGRIEELTKLKVDGAVSCIEWFSLSSLMILCGDILMEMTPDPLEITRTSRIEAPRHSQICRAHSMKGVDELLVYGTGGGSVLSPTADGIRCSGRFLCSGRITAAVQLKQGLIVCRIESHEDGVGSSEMSLNTMGREASLDRLMMPDGSSLPALPLDYSKEFAVTLPTTVFLCVIELVDGDNIDGASVSVIERARTRIDHRYTTSQIRGLTFLGTSRVSVLVSTTDEEDMKADNRHAFAWAQKAKAPSQWDAVTFRLQESVSDSPHVGSAMEGTPQTDTTIDTNQLYAEVVSLRRETEQMRDMVNKIGDDVAAIKRLMEMRLSQ